MYSCVSLFDLVARNIVDLQLAGRQMLIGGCEKLRSKLEPGAGGDGCVMLHGVVLLLTFGKNPFSAKSASCRVFFSCVEDIHIILCNKRTVFPPYGSQCCPLLIGRIEPAIPASSSVEMVMGNRHHCITQPTVRINVSWRASPV